MSEKKKIVKSLRENQRSYLNKDFNSFRSNMVEYGKTFFPDKINDFSETGLAGMFIEMAAYVGDTMSYYLDHQFNELDIVTAVENDNIEKLVRGAGVKIRGAAPASAMVDFFIESEAKLKNGNYVPNTSILPTIKAGTQVSSNSGIRFELLEDLIFSKTDTQGNIIAEYTVMKTNAAGNPASFAIKMSGHCSSGLTFSESFVIPDTFSPFLTITLPKRDVSEIVSVKDSEGNEYYEVEVLSQDTVYKRVSNLLPDSDLVSENIEVIPAPYRFITSTSRSTGKTKVRFGGGSSTAADSDIMPDPSEIAIPLYGKRKTFSRFTIDPNSLLKTRTLGIAPRNTTITVRYRSGGGLSHNVGENNIKIVSTLITRFSSAASASQIAKSRASTEASNPIAAKGGESQQTLKELRSITLAHRNSQSRIVTKEDLVSRIYTMPSNFGRVFRVGIRDNPNNPLASIVSIISRDINGKLIISPDSLKNNISTYVNQFRLISDAIDIVDAAVLNIKLEYGVVTDISSNSTLVLQKINNLIREYMKLENFQIDQPISTSDIANIILNTSGVVSLVDFKVINLSGVLDDREYSTSTFSVSSHTDRGLIIPPPGSIFEVRYPNDDIVGIAR